MLVLIPHTTLVAISLNTNSRNSQSKSMLTVLRTVCTLKMRVKKPRNGTSVTPTNRSHRMDLLLLTTLMVCKMLLRRTKATVVDPLSRRPTTPHVDLALARAHLPDGGGTSQYGTVSSLLNQITPIAHHAVGLLMITTKKGAFATSLVVSVPVPWTLVVALLAVALVVATAPKSVVLAAGRRHHHHHHHHQSALVSSPWRTCTRS